MALQLFSNNAETVLASSLTNIATSMSVATGDGALFNAPTGGNYEFLTITDGTNIEIVKCTARSSDTFTITRAQEGTSALSWNSGASVSGRITKATLDNFVQSSEINAAAIGDVLITAATPPAGFLLCDGSSKAFSTYSTLSGLLGGDFPSSFTARTSANASVWRSVCWSPELNLFCAVASSGGSTNQVMTSPDGITWTKRTSFAESWYDVCWSPSLGLFCACSTSSSTYRFMTSPDGITWTGRAGTGTGWVSICWSPELTLFVAVSWTGGTSGFITSPDGINWTTRTSPNSGWCGVCWSAELTKFVAVANWGDNYAATSPDGITWTGRTLTAHTWDSVAWSPSLGLFVTVHEDATSNAVATSPDGVTWTNRTSSDESSYWCDVTWAAELKAFIAVSYGGTTNRMMKSSDGINWSNVTTPNAVEYTGVIFSPALNRVCAVSASGTTAQQVITGDSTTFNLPTFSGSGSAKYYIKAL